MSPRSRKSATMIAANVRPLLLCASLLGACLVGAGIPCLAAAQSWPADAAWRPVDCGLAPSFDPRRDEPGAVNERDIVGNKDAPAAYLASDAMHVFFRLRVDGAPTVNDDFEPFGWGVAIDTNLDRLNYELLAIVDGTTPSDTVKLAQNTVYARPGDPSDAPEQTLATYPGADSARAVPAAGSFESSFGGNPDYFVDWAITRQDLMAAGVGATTPLALVFGTSRVGETLDADLACHVAGTDDRTFARAASDPVAVTGEVVDSDGDGLADLEEEERGSDPRNADSDGDGYPDGVEVREGTDPDDAASVPDNLKIRGAGGVAGGCALQSSSRTPWFSSMLAAIALLGLRKRRSRL